LLELDQDFACVGVGMAAAAMAVTQRLSRESFDEVILFGVAGGWPSRLLEARDSALEIGDCVLVGQDFFGDLGVQTPDGFESLESLGIGEIGPYAMDPAGTQAAAERLGCPVVVGVTVASGSGTDAAARAQRDRNRAQVESMEGAAVALVCARLGVPLVQLRAVSNYVGDRDRGAWSLDRACASVQDAVRRLLG
jgi:futalosine hydrolase